MVLYKWIVLSPTSRHHLALVYSTLIVWCFFVPEVFCLSNRIARKRRSLNICWCSAITSTVPRNRIHHLLHHFHPPILPFLTILECIIQTFVTRNTKHTTFLELLGQRDNVEVEKANFALVPIQGRIRVGTSFLVSAVTFVEEVLIPLAVNMPDLVNSVCQKCASVDQRDNKSGARKELTNAA